MHGTFSQEKVQKSQNILLDFLENFDTRKSTMTQRPEIDYEEHDYLWDIIEVYRFKESVDIKHGHFSIDPMVNFIKVAFISRNCHFSVHPIW